MTRVNPLIKPSIRIGLPALVLATFLAGCGQKGPLYMPKAKAEPAKRGAIVKPAPAPGLPVPEDAAPAPR